MLHIRDILRKEKRLLTLKTLKALCRYWYNCWNLNDDQIVIVEENKKKL